MVICDSRIQDGNDHVGAPRLEVPRFRQVDIRVVRLIEPVELREERVVRDGAQSMDPVRLRELDVRAS